MLAELAGSGAIPQLGDGHARIGASTPGFRLSSPGWTHFATRDLELITSGDRLYDLVREKLNGKLPTFAVRLKAFVDCYLADAERRARARFEGQDDPLITADDWIYSAFLPLPNARIQLPPKSFPTPSFVELSVLFWTGEIAIGVQLEPASSVIGSKKRNLEWLQENWPGFTLVELPRDRFSQAGDEFPVELFPDALTNFWTDVEMPQGPSLSGILESSLTG